MPQLYANNANSTVGSTLAIGGTTLDLPTGGGALFPTPTGGDFFLVTIYEIGAGGEENHEIVKCTARSTDALTIVREQEGTTAKEWAAGSYVALRMTAATIGSAFDMASMVEAADAKVLTSAERTILGNTSGTNSGDEAAASDTVAGISELATIAEIDTGTDTSRVITPAGLAGSALQSKVDGIEAGADVTDVTNVTAAGALMDSEVTNLADVKAFDPADYATAAQGSTADSAAKLDVAQTWTAAQRPTITTLTDGATITPNFATSNDFEVTLAGNRTLTNPTNIVAGQTGSIKINQDGTGSRTLAYGSYWKFTDGEAPVLTTTASAVDILHYKVWSTTFIEVVLRSNQA